MSQIKFLSDEILTQRVENLARREKQILHIVIEHLKEFDSRKLYLKFGYPSLFQYMTEKLKYSQGAAQRRIDAARLCRVIPEVGEKIEKGELQLSQISVLQKAFRQAEKEHGPIERANEKKAEILSLIENKSYQDTERIVAEELAIAEVRFEKTTIQRDGSVRLEITVSGEQMKQLEKCKELLSHRDPSATWSEVMGMLAADFIKRSCRSAVKKNSDEQVMRVKEEVVLAKDSIDESSKLLEHEGEKSKAESQSHKRQSVPRSIQRAIKDRDQCCQYTDPKTGNKCGSRFLLQIDHIKPVWAGGDNSESNLQVLCAQHNQMKYFGEANIRFV